MSSVAEIESAIERLPSEQVREIAAFSPELLMRRASARCHQLSSFGELRSLMPAL
jgi:hypothetical protein